MNWTYQVCPREDACRRVIGVVSRKVLEVVADAAWGDIYLTAALATSNGLAAKALLECTEADVFNYLDRHADTTCFLTVHEPVQAVLRSVGMDMKVLAVNALSQRCSTARSKYKRPTAVNPTILVHMNALDAPDNVTRLTSFEVELQRVLSRGSQATARVTTAFVDLGHSRDEYLYLEGDISFCVAGDVVRADKSGADAAEELWWAFQLASRFAHSRLTGLRPESCTIEILWLDKCNGGYRLVPDASEKIKYGSIIKEEDGSPIMVRRESMEARGLTSIWQDEVGLVYVR